MLWFGMYDVVAHGNTPCRGIITSCLVQVLYLSWNGHNFGNDSYIIIRCIIRCVKKQSFGVNEIVWVYWQEAWRNNFDKDQNSFIWLPNTFLAMSPFWLAGSTPSTQYTVHSTQCTVHSTQYTVHMSCSFPALQYSTLLLPVMNCIPLIFSPLVDEKAKEEEAYRLIKMKMRAEQLLAESDLPRNMKRHAIHYTGNWFSYWLKLNDILSSCWCNIVLKLSRVS